MSEDHEKCEYDLEENDVISLPNHRLGASTEHMGIIEAHRALIEQYFIEAGQGVFSLVRSHQRPLQEWHTKHTKWHLENYQGVFYLQRIPSSLPPIQDMKGLLDQRDLAYLFWILWYAAEGHARLYAPTQYFSLQDLRNQIQEQWQLLGKYAVLELDTLKSNRKSLIRALTYLVQHRYLDLKRGEPEEWVETRENSDGIYYHFTDLTALLIASLQVKSIELSKTRIRQLHEEIQPAYLSISSAADEPITRAWRNILLGPVFLRYDDPEAFAWLRQHASEVERTLARTFGWLIEINQDYACMVRASTDSSRRTISFNMSSPLDQQILLLCGTLRQHVSNGTLSLNTSGCILISEEELRQIFLPVYQDFVDRSTMPTPKKTVNQYFVDICQKMRRIGFIRGPDAVQNILILPTAALYAPVYAQELVKPEQTIEEPTPSLSEYIQCISLWPENQDTEN